MGTNFHRTVKKQALFFHTPCDVMSVSLCMAHGSTPGGPTGPSPRSCRQSSLTTAVVPLRRRSPPAAEFGRLVEYTASTLEFKAKKAQKGQKSKAPVCSVSEGQCVYLTDYLYATDNRTNGGIWLTCVIEARYRGRAWLTNKIGRTRAPTFQTTFLRSLVASIGSKAL